MKKKYIIFILFVNLLNSQNRFFSYNGEEMRDKIISLYEKNRSKEAKLLAEDIYDFYQDLSTEKSKIEFIDLLNKFQEEKIYGYTNYRNFANSLNKIIKTKYNKEQWVSNCLRIFSEKGLDYQWFFDNNNSIFNSKILTKDKNIVWEFSGDKNISFIEDTLHRFLVEGGEMFCRYGKNEYSVIKKIKGIYDLQNLKFYIEKGELDWSRNGKNTEDLYVEINKDTIDLRYNYYELNNVFFTSKYLGIENFKGKVKHKTYRKGNYENSLLYESYSDINYNHISGDYTYNGILKYDGVKYSLLKDNKTGKRAKLDIKRKGKILFEIEGNLFSLEENKITSSSIYFHLNTIDSTSILGGPNTLIYDFKNKVLVIEEITDNKYKTMTHSSYHNIGFSLSKLYYNLDSSWVYFVTSKDLLLMISDDYYENTIHKKFRGISDKNTLEKLDNILKRLNKTEVTFSELSNEMKIPKKDIYWILAELSKIGYVSVDLSSEIVIFFEKFFDLEKLKSNSIDSDNMYVEKLSENKQAVFKYNLQTGLLKGVNGERINISSTQNVSISPYEGKFDMKKNRNIIMPEGLFTVGLYNLWGRDVEFNYDDYIFNIKGNNTMSMDIPLIDNKKGDIVDTKNIINRIDSIKGKIIINNKNNKSNKKDSLQYPKFYTDKDSYIYYDNPIFMKGNYVRDRFYVKVYPFFKDSIIVNATYKKLFFDGNVHTEIFPDFEERIKVQKDYTLGFVRKTPEEGYPIYGGKGNFNNILSLGSKGLRGIGKFSYSASESESEDIDFYLDSLKSNTKKFEIKETENENINVPNVLHDKVSLKWDVKNDTMYLKSKTSFNLYNKLVRNEGMLKLTSQNLTGAGQASLRNGKVKAKLFNFRAKDFFSNQMDFALRENNKSEYEFFINDAYGNIDIVNKKGEFRLNSDTASINIDIIKFKAFFRNVYWDMNSTSVLMKKEGDSSSVIESTDIEREGLNFKAGQAIYNLATKSLSSEDVENIKVSDAIIYPIDKKLVVNRKGVKEIQKALIEIIGTDKRGTLHKYKESSVTINTGKKYEAKGKYVFQDIEGNETYIDFDRIYSNINTGNISKGEGFIEKKQKFKISPNFEFYGKVFMMPNKEDLTFEGKINLLPLCVNKYINIGKDININTPVNRDTLSIKLGFIDNVDSKKKEEDINYYNAIIYKKVNSFSSVFVSDYKLDPKENIYISNTAQIIKYDKNNSCYVTENKEGYNSFFYDDCRLRIQGELKFHNMGVLENEGFSDMEQNLKDKVIKFNDFTYMSNFHFDESILDNIIDEFDYKDTVKDLVKLEFDNDRVDTYKYFINKNKLDEDKLKERDILIKNMSLKWNEETNSFFSKDSLIHILQLNKEEFQKKLKGKFEIQRDDISDIITIYFEHPHKGHYYFFRFSKNRVNFYTDNKEIMSKYEELREKGRDVKIIDGQEYEYRTPSMIVIKAFLKKYY